MCGAAASVAGRKPIQTDSGFSDAKAGTKRGGAGGDFGNNFGIDGAIVAGVFGGGSGDGEAVGALKNVSVIVADGGGQRSSGKAVAEQVTFHWE